MIIECTGDDKILSRKIKCQFLIKINQLDGMKLRVWKGFQSLFSALSLKPLYIGKQIAMYPDKRKNESNNPWEGVKQAKGSIKEVNIWQNK